MLRPVWLYNDFDIAINKGYIVQANEKINLCTFCTLLFLKFALFAADA